MLSRSFVLGYRNDCGSPVIVIHAALVTLEHKEESKFRIFEAVLAYITNIKLTRAMQ